MAARLKQYGVKLLDFISGVFTPIIGVILAAGILKGAVAVFSLAGGAPPILAAVADTLYYFLPVLLSVSAAVSFKYNPVTAGLVGCILVNPAMPHIYASTVFPALLTVPALWGVDRLCRKIPETYRGLVTPLASVILAGGFAYFAAAPAGVIAGDGIAAGYEAAYRFSPALAGGLIGLFIQPMVVVGLQWGLVPVAINNAAVGGGDTITAFMAPPVFAQVGACLAVFLKTRDNALKSNSLAAGVISLFGVTEPALFGVTFKYRRPLLCVAAAGGLGGAVAGVSGVFANAFAFPSVLTLPLFLGDGFPLFILANALGLTAGFALTFLWGYKGGNKVT